MRSGCFSMWSATVVLVAVATLAPGAPAQAIPVTLEATSFVRDPLTSGILVEDSKSATTMTGDATVEVTTLLTEASDTRGRPFPGRNGPPFDLFMSARSTGEGVFEVGVAGIPSFGNNNYVARATQTFTVTNPNSGAANFHHEFEVFPIEVRSMFLNGPSFDVGPRSIVALLRGEFVKILGDGTRLASEEYFNYSITLATNVGGRMDAVFSPDLAAVLGETVLDTMGNQVPLVGSRVTRIPEDPASLILDILAVTVDPFRRQLLVTQLEPGESVEVKVAASAVLNNTAEFGGLALIGDPFKVDLPLKDPPFVSQLVPVPEPGAALLVLGGLVGLALSKLPLDSGVGLKKS